MREALEFHLEGLALDGLPVAATRLVEVPTFVASPGMIPHGALRTIDRSDAAAAISGIQWWRCARIFSLGD